MKQVKKAFSLCLAAVLLVAGCGRKNPASFTARPFPSVTLPGLIDDDAAAAEYIAEHFWDDFTDTASLFPCDSSHVNGVAVQAVEQEFVNYITIISSFGEEKAGAWLSGLFDRACLVEKADTSSNVLETVVELSEKYLYDPNSPLRNEDIYRPAVSKFALYEGFPAEKRAAYGFDAKMCSLNMVGSAAADFVFSDRNGRSYSLYDFNTDYILLFFSNPGCEACKVIIDVLRSDPEISSMVSDKKLSVLNIYIDENIADWYEYLPVYPEEWYNGYDPNFIIRSDVLYNVRAIPSLYLLDGDKRVIMKDAPQEKVFYYLRTRND